MHGKRMTFHCWHYDLWWLKMQAEERVQESENFKESLEFISPKCFILEMRKVRPKKIRLSCTRLHTSLMAEIGQWQAVIFVFSFVISLASVSRLYIDPWVSLVCILKPRDDLQIYKAFLSHFKSCKILETRLISEVLSDVKT